MTEDPNRYASENLPKYRWDTFFKELLASRKGQPVNVLEGADFLHAEIPTDTMPLANIEYDSHHSGTLKHKGLLTITTGEPDAQSFAVNVPTIVWVYQDLEGIIKGIEVIDELNNRVVLRFA